MKVTNLVDNAYQHMTMMAGMSVEEKLRLLDILRGMVLKDWTAVDTAAPVLTLVAGG